MELSAALLLPAPCLHSSFLRRVRFHWPGFASGVSCDAAEHLPKCVTLTPQAVTLSGDISAVAVSEEIQHSVAKYHCPSPSCFSFQVSWTAVHMGGVVAVFNGCGPLTSTWASREMGVCVLHKLCIYELLNWFPLLQIKALVFALYWSQGEPSRKQTALLVLERTKKESNRQELVCVLNNLSDLSEVLQEMPCGVRRTAVGSRQLSRMGVCPLAVFV